MKKKIFSIISITGFLATITALFFNIWAFTNGEINPNFVYKLFDAFPKSLELIYTSLGEKLVSIWATLTMIATIISIIAGLTYLVFTIIKFLKVKKVKTEKFRMYASILSLIAFALTFTFSALFTIVNHVDLGLTYIEMMGLPALYVLLGGMLISGLFGLLSLNGKKRKK